MTIEDQCPSCGGLLLKNWQELDDEERAVVLRLPGAADYSLQERQTHRWCTRCWYEETGPASMT